MKTLSFIVLFLFLLGHIRAGDAFSLNKLKKEDSFTLKITVPAGSGNVDSPWDFKEVQKIEVSCEVLSANNDSVRLAIKPTNWFVCYRNKNSLQTEKTGCKLYAYLDSYYFQTTTWGHTGSMFYLFKENNVTAAVNTNDGGINITYVPIPEDNDNHEKSRKLWRSSIMDVPTGLKYSEYNRLYPDIELDFEKVLQSSLEHFFKEWSTTGKAGLPIPQILDLRKEYNLTENNPAFVQLVSGSFNLPSNIHLTYQAPQHIPEDRIFILLQENKIKPVKQAAGMYDFDFFLSSPKRVRLGETILDLTPGDSITITYNPVTGSYSFSGTGAGNCAYINKIAAFYEERPSFCKESQKGTFSPEAVAEYFTKGETLHKMLSETYGHRMNRYWKTSAEMAYNYWYASEKIKLNNEIIKYHRKNSSAEYEIPWQDKHFHSLLPFVDYLYQPYTYGSLLERFFEYKALLANDDVLSGMKYFLSYIPKYYFSDASFWGYPKTYLTGESLKYLMTNYHLSQSQREYEDFLEKNVDPEIRNTLIHLHEQLTKAEPGANIKNLDLAIRPSIPLKEKADGYVVLFVGDTLPPSFEKNMKSMYDEIAKENLSDKINVCVITSESQKSRFDTRPELQQKITFVPDNQIRDYYDKVVCIKGTYLTMKNDGTLLDRFTTPYAGENDSSSHYILFLIKKDMAAPQKENTASSGYIFTILLSVLLSIGFTFLIVRTIIKRRERTKRVISELELKAIRAQMNPHFTFNALGSIQHLINQKKEKEANDYLVHFATLLRMVLSTSEKMFIPLSEEIAQLELYLRLEQLRIPFEYTIRIDDNINPENEEIPGMLIQPIAENAVKHGIAGNGNDRIVLDFSLSNRILYISVSDSGHGFHDSETGSKKGFGLQAVHDRLKLLNKEFHLDINMKIENTVTAGNLTGCAVTVSMPI